MLPSGKASYRTLTGATSDWTKQLGSRVRRASVIPCVCSQPDTRCPDERDRCANSFGQSTYPPESSTIRLFRLVNGSKFRGCHVQFLAGIIGSAVSLLAAIPYGYAIYRRTTRPHLFSWLIWSVVTAIAAAGQFVAGAGPSAWCTAAISRCASRLHLPALRRADDRPSRLSSCS